MKNMIGRKLLLLSSLLITCFSPIDKNPRLGYVGEKNYLVRWCDHPQFIIINPSIPEHKRQPIEQAIIYFNSILDFDLFMFAGVIDIPPSRAGIVILERPKELFKSSKEDICARTLVRMFASGCIVQAIVYIEPSCFSQPDDIFETVIRHELGHVIGLVHSTIFTDLMAANIEWTMQHPIDFSTEELETIYSLY